MAAPYHAESAWFGDTNSTSTSHTFTGSTRGVDLPASGDVILFWAYASDEGATKGGVAATATASGRAMTLVDHDRPATQWRGFINVFKLTSNGTETEVTITWGEQSAWGKTLNVAFVDPGDIDSTTIAVEDIAVYSGTSWSWSADNLDNTLHCFGSFDNDDAPTAVLPTGDTELSNAGGTNYRTAGWGVSGGGTTSQTQSDSYQGIVFNLNYDNAAGGSAHVTEIDAPTASQVLAPNSAHPNIQATITGGASNVKTVEYIINNTTDTTTWNEGTTTWDAGSDHTNSDTGLSEASPYTHTFSTDLPSDVLEGKSFELKVRAADQSDTFGSYDTITYTSGTWIGADAITFVAEDDGNPGDPDPNVIPTVVITSPGNGQQFDNTTTSIPVTGTSADSDGTVSTVELRYQIDGAGSSSEVASVQSFTAWTTVTDTGTNFDTWSYTITPVAAGQSVHIEARAQDDEGDYSTVATATVYIAASTGATVYNTGTLAPTLASRNPTDFYRLIYADVSSGVIHGELPVTAFNWSRVLNGADQITATIPLKVDNASPALNATNLRPGSTALWVIRDGRIMAGGIVVAYPSIDVDGNVATITANGFHHYFTRRHILSNLDYDFVDQTEIAAALIDLAGPAIRVGTSYTASSVLRSRTYRWWTTTSIAQAVDELAATDDGFDFRYDYSWTANLPTATFVTVYPNTGRSTSHRFDIGSNCDLIVAERDGTNLGNVAITLGGGDAASTPRSILTDSAGLAGMPIYEHVDTYPNVVTVGTLAQHGGDRLKRTRQPMDRIRVRLYRGTRPLLGSFEMGDRVGVSGSHGWWNISGTMRITAVSVAVQDGGETAVVDLAPLQLFV